MPGRLCTCSGRLGLMKGRGGVRIGGRGVLHGEGAQQRGRDVQRVKCLQEFEGWFVCHLRDCNAEGVYQTT